MIGTALEKLSIKYELLQGFCWLKPSDLVKLRYSLEMLLS